MKEWLTLLAPYVGILVTLWLGLHVRKEVNGRMTEFRDTLRKLAASREAEIRAEALEPVNVATAAALVKSDAKEARTLKEAIS